MRLLLALVVCLPVWAGTAGGSDPDSLIANRHWKRARSAAEAAYKANPNDARANYWLGRVLHEFGKLDEAQKLLETAVKLDPKSALFHRELGEIYGDQVEKASVFRQMGVAHKCRAEFDAALAIAPKDAMNIYDRMIYYIQAPGIAGGDNKKAAELAVEIGKVDPALGYLAQARIARHLKQPEKLEGLYNMAVEANPRDFEARRSLAAFYLSPGHLNGEQVEKHGRVMLELNADRIEGYRMVAVGLAFQKKVEEAAQIIARAESAIPDDLSPYVMAGRALIGNPAELGRAEAWVRKYIEKTTEPEPGAPLIAGAHHSLGLIHEKQGRKADAIREMETALRLKPDFEPAKKDLKRLK